MGLEPETKIVLLNKTVDYILVKPVSIQAISVSASVASVNVAGYSRYYSSLFTVAGSKQKTKNINKQTL